MKYFIGQTVKVKATGEKVKIVGDDRMQITFLNKTRENEYYLHKRGWFKESELKPYCPSRTGTRDPNTGRFVSKEEKYPLWTVKTKVMPFNPDSKQRNYQKIEYKVVDNEYQTLVGLIMSVGDKLIDLEKKIDELGRRV